MELWLIPFGLFFVVHDKGGWKNVFLLTIFLLLFIGGIIFMGIDLFNGVMFPLDPRSMFVTAIPWTFIFLFLFLAVTAWTFKKVYKIKRQKNVLE
ncbi:MAG: hypothetical protein AAB610_00545 [Patescibacteria group bacterium]